MQLSGEYTFETAPETLFDLMQNPDTLMACLPDETNFIEATAFPIGQPFLGRG